MLSLVKPLKPSEVFEMFKKTIGRAADGSRTASVDAGQTGRFKILLVEDNKVNQRVAMGMLQNLNCTVNIAENGRVCLEKLAKDDYDMILMDCQMPVCGIVHISLSGATVLKPGQGTRRI